MKTILNLSVLFLLSAVLFTACKKDETKLYYTGGTAPVLSALASADTVSYANANLDVLNVKWTNPNYMFTTGVSSLDVSYQLQIDTVGSNFTNPNMKVIGISKDVAYTFTSSALNDIMLNQLNLQKNMQHNLEMRVVSNLTNNSAQLISNSVQYSATAYAIPPKVTPPSSGTLFIVGSAVGSWDNPIAEGNVSSQQFEQISETEYQITTDLVGDGEYKFIQTNGLWDNQWSVKTEQASGDPTTLGTDLYFNGGNVRAPLSSGKYLIDVDFQKGKFTLTKQ